MKPNSQRPSILSTPYNDNMLKSRTSNQSLLRGGFVLSEPDVEDVQVVMTSEEQLDINKESMVSSSKAKTLTIVEEPSFNISEEHKTTENESNADGDDSDATNPFLTHKPDKKAKKKPFASTYVPPAPA